MRVYTNGQSNMCQGLCRGNENYCSENCELSKALDILSEYEDSGMLPSEVVELAKAKLDERLIILPCKIGDEIELHNCGVVQKYKFMGIIQQKGYLPQLFGRQLFGKYNDVPIANIDSWDKTVFLSK